MTRVLIGLVVLLLPVLPAAADKQQDKLISAGVRCYDNFRAGKFGVRSLKDVPAREVFSQFKRQLLRHCSSSLALQNVALLLTVRHPPGGLCQQPAELSCENQ